MNNNPILNNPYTLPLLHYATDPKDGSLNYNDVRKERRIFSRDKQVIPMKQVETILFDFNDNASHDDLNHIVNLLRKASPLKAISATPPKPPAWVISK